MTHHNPNHYVLYTLTGRDRIALERGNKGCWLPGEGHLNKEGSPCGDSYWCGAPDDALLLTSSVVVVVAIFDVAAIAHVACCWLR